MGCADFTPPPKSNPKDIFRQLRGETPADALGRLRSFLCATERAMHNARKIAVQGGNGGVIVAMLSERRRQLNLAKAELTAAIKSPFPAQEPRPPVIVPHRDGQRKPAA